MALDSVNPSERVKVGNVTGTVVGEFGSSVGSLTVLNDNGTTHIVPTAEIVETGKLAPKEKKEKKSTAKSNGDTPSPSTRRTRSRGGSK